MFAPQIIIGISVIAVHTRNAQFRIYLFKLRSIGFFVEKRTMPYKLKDNNGYILHCESAFGRNVCQIMHG